MTTTAAEPVDARQLNLISLVLVLGALTTLLDTTIVNIALDRLHDAFHASVADTQWVATGYLLAYVSVIPITGWLSERFGSRRTWMVAVATFMVGSLLCGLAWSLPALVVFRVLQGLGGGMVLPLTITILTNAAGRERIGRAMATIGLIGQLAPILGPIIGGSLIESATWHWLFLVNIPLCLVALALGPRILPVGAGEAGHRFDGVGFGLLTPGVALMAYGISQVTGPDGFAAVGAWLPLAVGAVLLVGFAFHALRIRERALIDVRIFARRSFGLSSVITFMGGFSTYALMFLLPLFYQQARGETVLHTGLLLIPQGLGSMLFIVLSRKLSAKYDGRLIVAGGVVLMMLGTVPFALAGTTGETVLLLVAQLAQGVGLAAVALPLMTMAFTDLAPAETPRASAAFSVVQRVGAPFGVTVVAVILEHYLRGAADAEGVATAFGHAFWWVCGLSVVPLLLTVLIPSNRPAAPREAA